MRVKKTASKKQTKAKRKYVKKVQPDIVDPFEVKTEALAPNPIAQIIGILREAYSPEEQNQIMDMVIKEMAATRIANASSAEANHNRCSECLDDFTKKFGKVTYKPSL